MGARAYRAARTMVWSTVGVAYRRLFMQVAQHRPSVGIPIHVDATATVDA